MNYLILFFSVGFLVAAQLFLKKGMQVAGRQDFNLANLFSMVGKTFTNPYLLIGLAFFGAGFFVWLFAVSRFKLNIIYPINTSLAIAFVALFSWIIFKEQMNVTQIIGLCVIIAGIFLIVNHG